MAVDPVVRRRAQAPQVGRSGNCALPSSGTLTPRIWCSWIRLRSKDEPRPGEVERPDLGGARGRPRGRLVPVVAEVAAPVAAGHGVVLAQVLLVPHLEALVLHDRHHRARAGQLAVGEDVAVDETRARDAGVAVVDPGDAVVEQPPPVTQPVAQEAEVGRVVLHADVLGQPDRADRVEAGLADLAVVAVPHLRGAGQPLLRDGLGGPRRLLLRERDAEGRDAVVLDGVAHHAAPAAARRPAAACPGRRSSLRQTRSYLSACASSRVASAVG